MDDLANIIADATGAPPTRNSYNISTSGTSASQKQSPLETALQAEGVTGPKADLARSIYQQESTAGKNTATSNAGAVGGMQVTPGTFSGVADKGWNINDPVQNARAGVRYASQMYDKASGDPAIAAAGYYGGAGGLTKAQQGIAVSDPHNPGAPTTLQYGAQVAGRMQSGYQPPQAFNADTVIAALNGSSDIQAPDAPHQTAPAPTKSMADQIPGIPGANTTLTKEQPESLWDKAKGLGEAALATGTGLVAGVVGPAAGLGYGLTHDYGTAAGAKAAENVGSNVANSLTYQPSTQAGQRYAQNVGDAVNNSGVVALAPIAEMSALGSMAPAAMDQAKAALPSKISTQAPSIANRIEPTLEKPRIKINADGSQTPIENSGALPPSGPPSAPTIADTPPAFQQAMQGKANDATLQRHVEAQSLPVPMELTKGQATGDINQLSFEQNNRGAQPALAQQFNRQNGDLIENINAIRDNAAPDVTAVNHVENGQSLIDSYKAKDATLNADISAKYQALQDANGGQFPVDGKAFVNAADQALAQKMKGRYVPPEIQADMDSLRDGGPMTYENFENMRTNLAAEARKADRAGDGNRAMATGIVRDALESLPMTGEAAEVKPIADAARSAAKARFDLLNNDPAYKAAVNGTVAPDDFINKFVVNGKVNAIKAMRDNLVDDPLAGQTIAAGTVNYLKNRAGLVGDTGNFSQAGYNKALQAVGPKLGQLFEPKEAQQLQTLGNVARYTQEQPRGSFVNNSNTLVGTLANNAKELGMGVLNAKTYGASGLIRNKLAERAVSKSVQKAMEPGAGTTKLSNFP